MREGLAVVDRFAIVGVEHVHHPLVGLVPEDEKKINTLPDLNYGWIRWMVEQGFQKKTPFFFISS